MVCIGQKEEALSAGEQALVACRKRRRWEDAMVVLETMEGIDGLSKRRIGMSPAETILFDRSAIMAMDFFGACTANGEETIQGK